MNENHFLIAGLGNIGPEYELTRHNAGFLAVDRLADAIKAPPFTTGRLAFFTHTSLKNKKLTLIKPTTFMNLSGKAINHWLKDLNISKENLIVLTDEIALPYGKVRLKGQGTNGGHNGLGNIQEILGTTEYNRIRIGVGSDFPKGKQVDYVLGNFSKDEFAGLELILDRCVSMVSTFCLEGRVNAMNKYNN